MTNLQIHLRKRNKEIQKKSKTISIEDLCKEYGLTKASIYRILSI